MPRFSAFSMTETALKEVASGTTYPRKLGQIEAVDSGEEGRDVEIEVVRIRPEVTEDLVTQAVHPQEGSIRVAPGAEGFMRGEVVRRREMTPSLMEAGSDYSIPAYHILPNILQNILSNILLNILSNIP